MSRVRHTLWIPFECHRNFGTQSMCFSKRALCGVTSVGFGPGLAALSIDEPDRRQSPDSQQAQTHGLLRNLSDVMPYRN
jgi:hypothetical protein